MKFYPEEKNVGSWDRGARLIVGPVLVLVGIAAALGTIALAPVLIAISLVVGAILTVTGLTQKCPMNRLFGINTYKGEPSTKDAETEPTERPA
ncbi:DUF2892 domain-containing protein [Halalkalicoccus sp. NIPERK01]|uniref:YgaP family membrane protein n=1 Tax=Halalkalicoccus sp. NIPERK01 TaxID=3053469 RepID=UPI00256EAE71|nr:DUF2892 domain-containing protein [Halalkalicoccus sp. NIPERK01]MDL5360918.1 DUF2892 domain-containing protein [Halalkalicoccus sp. NIPERK01]